jgi:hypothetical protein
VDRILKEKKTIKPIIINGNRRLVFRKSKRQKQRQTGIMGSFIDLYVSRK